MSILRPSRWVRPTPSNPTRGVRPLRRVSQSHYWWLRDSCFSLRSGGQRRAFVGSIRGVIFGDRSAPGIATRVGIIPPHSRPSGEVSFALLRCPAAEGWSSRNRVCDSEVGEAGQRISRIWGGRLGEADAPPSPSSNPFSDGKTWCEPRCTCARGVSRPQKPQFLPPQQPPSLKPREAS